MTQLKLNSKYAELGHDYRAAWAFQLTNILAFRSPFNHSKTYSRVAKFHCIFGFKNTVSKVLAVNQLQQLSVVVVF